MFPSSAGRIYKKARMTKLYRIKPSRGQNAFEGFIAYNLLELKAKAGAKSTKKMAYPSDCF